MAIRSGPTRDPRSQAAKLTCLQATRESREQAPGVFGAAHIDVRRRALQSSAQAGASASPQGAGDSEPWTPSARRAGEAFLTTEGRRR